MSGAVWTCLVLVMAQTASPAVNSNAKERMANSIAKQIESVRRQASQLISLGDTQENSGLLLPFPQTPRTAEPARVGDFAPDENPAPVKPSVDRKSVV